MLSPSLQLSPYCARAIITVGLESDYFSVNDLAVDFVTGASSIETARLRLRPIAEGRIHIPIGHGGGGRRLGVPTSFAADWSGNVAAAVPGYDDGTVLLYNVGTSNVSFVLYSNGTWAAPKTIPLNDKLSAEAAIAALVRMLSQ